MHGAAGPAFRGLLRAGMGLGLSSVPSHSALWLPLWPWPPLLWSGGAAGAKQTSWGECHVRRAHSVGLAMAGLAVLPGALTSPSPAELSSAVDSTPLPPLRRSLGGLKGSMDSGEALACLGGLAISSQGRVIRSLSRPLLLPALLPSVTAGAQHDCHLPCLLPSPALPSAPTPPEPRVSWQRGHTANPQNGRVSHSCNQGQPRPVTASRPSVSLTFSPPATPRPHHHRLSPPHSSYSALVSSLPTLQRSKRPQNTRQTLAPTIFTQPWLLIIPGLKSRRLSLQPPSFLPPALCTCSCSACTVLPLWLLLLFLLPLWRPPHLLKHGALLFLTSCLSV